MVGQEKYQVHFDKVVCEISIKHQNKLCSWIKRARIPKVLSYTVVSEIRSDYIIIIKCCLQVGLEANCCSQHDLLRTLVIVH